MTSVLASLLFFALSSTSVHAEEFEIRWAMAHEPENQRLVDATTDFGKNLEKESKGRLKFKIVYYKEDTEDLFAAAIEDTYKGKLEMSQISTNSLRKFSPSLGVFDLPLLMTSHSHVAQVLDGDIGNGLREQIFSGTNKRIRSMGFTYSGGSRHFLYNKTAVNLDNLSEARARMSVPFEETSVLDGLNVRFVDCEKCGEKRNLAKQLESGAIQIEHGHMNRFATILSHMKPEAMKNMAIAETEHSFFLTTVVVNEEFFQKLPKDLQQVLETNVKKLVKIEREVSIDFAEKNRALLLSKGLKIERASPKLMGKIRSVAKNIQKARAGSFGDLALRISKVSKQTASLSN